MSKISFIIYRSDLKKLWVRQKGAKNYQLVGIEIRIDDNTKSIQTQLGLNFP